MRMSMVELHNIVLASIGLVTPLGAGAAATWAALCAGGAIGDEVGRVKTETETQGDRVSTLGRLAARQAMAGSGWQACSGERTGLVLGTSKGPVDRWLESHSRDLTALPSTSDNQEGRSRVEMVRPPLLGLHTVCDDVALSVGLGDGPRLTVSAACASGLVALIRGVMMLRDGMADRVLIVASESSLHPMFLASFRRLGVWAPDGEPVRPMDCRRSGFRISEAAAAVCLERRQPRAGEVSIDGFGLGGDAHHLTGVDPAGRALEACLRRAIGGRPVDLVHAHATGTGLNDPIELSAIERSLSASQDGQPLVYSHKAALGHSLGAAGLVSVVLNCLMHAHGRAPGNIHTQSPLPAERLRIARGAVDARITRSVAIAAGFGGATAAVSLISH
jgi:3-oxoacyl-[acyl-carrier-protein] synthase II